MLFSFAIVKKNNVYLMEWPDFGWYQNAVSSELTGITLLAAFFWGKTFILN
jgi:hypothetical protein